MPSYLFDVGNSATGPIGYCARLTAPSRKVALRRLRAYVAELAVEGITVFDDRPGERELPVVPCAGLEYLRVYFGTHGLTFAQIDDVCTDDV